MGGILLMAGQWGLAGAQPLASARRQASLRRRLARAGVDLRFLYPEAGRDIHPAALAIAAALEQRSPGAVLRVPARNDMEAYQLRWPKDAIQAYGGGVAVVRSAAARRIAAACGAAQVRASPWCEGGMVVRAGPALLVSTALLGRRGLPPVPGRHRVVPLPAPSRHMAGAPTHIDLDCAAAVSPEGRILLLFSPAYFEACGAELTRAARRLRADVFVAPAAEAHRRALNLVALPGAVLMPAGCPQTRAALASHLGEQRVIAVRIDRSFNYNAGFGGLACMSAFLPAAALARGASSTFSSASR